MSLLGQSIDELFPDVKTNAPIRKKWNLGEKLTHLEEQKNSKAIHDSTSTTEAGTKEKTPPTSYLPRGMYLNFENAHYTREAEYNFTLEKTELMEEQVDLDDLRKQRKTRKKDPPADSSVSRHEESYIRSIRELLMSLSSHSLPEVPIIHTLLEQYIEQAGILANKEPHSQDEKSLQTLQDIEHRIDSLILVVDERNTAHTDERIDLE